MIWENRTNPTQHESMNQLPSPSGQSLPTQTELTRTNLSEEFRHTGLHPTPEETDRIHATISALLSCDQFSVTFSAKGVDFGGARATAVRVIYYQDATPQPIGGKACFDMIMRVSVSFDVECHYKDRGSRLLKIRVDREMTSRDMFDLVEECAYARIRSNKVQKVPFANGGVDDRKRYEEREKLHASLLSIHTEDGGIVTGDDAVSLLYVTRRKFDQRRVDALVHTCDGSTRPFTDIFASPVLNGFRAIGDISKIVGLQGNPLRVFMQSAYRDRRTKALVRQIATSDTKKMRIKEEDDADDDEDRPAPYKTAFLADVALGLSDQPGKWGAIRRVSDFVEKAVECKSKDIAEIMRMANEKREIESRRTAIKEEHEKAQAILSQLHNKLQITRGLFD